MVKQEVIVHVQLVEHPAQGVLADGKDAGVKPCRGKDMSQLPPSLLSHALLAPQLSAPRGAPGPTLSTSSPGALPLHGYSLSSLLPEHVVVVGWFLNETV